MKTNNQIILKKKKGQWWNIADNKPFSGFASVIDKAKQTDAFNKRAVRGFTPTEMNAEVLRLLSKDFRTINHLA